MGFGKNWLSLKNALLNVSFLGVDKKPYSLGLEKPIVGLLTTYVRDTSVNMLFV